MGGLGSGRYERPGKRLTTRYRSVDVRTFQRKGLLQQSTSFWNTWTEEGKFVYCMHIEVNEDQVLMSYPVYEHQAWTARRDTIRLESQPCHFGGERFWFRCPIPTCGRRVALLYKKKTLACRICHQLAYPSQRQHWEERSAIRAQKIRERLGWAPSILDGTGAKPPRMHGKTFRKLKAQHDHYALLSLAWGRAMYEVAFGYSPDF